MKRTSVFKLAIAFIGVFLGAGFVSGQELWQFFACFGIWGFAGFLVSVALMFVVDYALLHAAQKAGTSTVFLPTAPSPAPRPPEAVNSRVVSSFQMAPCTAFTASPSVFL